LKGGGLWPLGHLAGLGVGSHPLDGGGLATPNEILGVAETTPKGPLGHLAGLGVESHPLDGGGLATPNEILGVAETTPKGVGGGFGHP
jgi:hypothetical protein